MIGQWNTEAVLRAAIRRSLDCHEEALPFKARFYGLERDRALVQGPLVTMFFPFFSSP